MIRTSIHIDGNRILDNEFTGIIIYQEIGQHNTFVISLKQDAIKGVLLEKVKSWIGNPISIGLGNQDDEQILNSSIKNYFNGVITSIGINRKSGASELLLKGESPTIILDDGPNTRSFTDKSLQEIVDEVFSPYKNTFPEKPAVEAQMFMESIPYCVQYKESNYDFIRRLADRYGEWYLYDGINMLFGKLLKEDPIILNFGENGLTDFDISVNAIPAKFKVRAYDYKSHKGIEAESKLNTVSSAIGEEAIKISTSKIFTQSPSVSFQTFVDQAELDNIVERQEQISLDETVVVLGFSKNSNLKIGAEIEVNDQLINESYGSFIVTKLEHTIGQTGDYINKFEAIPSEVKTPPIKSIPAPPFCETQIATVTDVNDTDALGRVKVQFIWQSGSSEKSPWLRVATPYTGKNKGFYITPEIGDQVLVAFENNNPDKPYVLSGLYNSDAKPEWFDPKNRYKGFKSARGNQLKFDDKNQSVLIHAPSTITLSAGNKINLFTGGKEETEINLNVGEGTINLEANIVNVHVKKQYNLVADEKVKVYSKDVIIMQADNELLMNATTKTELKSDAEVEIASTEINVVGSALVDMAATLVKINS